ncbi:PREDICTED: WD repeat-containing protein 74-like [Branchiostoma belcheri]|uniref:WD repeat-containing protein 74 n=1 Tax=Branchiostoma belcheri TaxID=7741 RepID=A0A6P4YT93_BRABE|nr:PREDICTED: WD repeat-containing protein 74-like [Branchiostoma belcheri]
MAASMQHVFVGAATGVFKGVNLAKKTATNFQNVASLSKEDEICAMCWGNQQESQVCIGLKNGLVKTFDAEQGEFTDCTNCAGGEGRFTGLAKYQESLVTCVESGLLRVWKDEGDKVDVEVGKDVCRMRQNPALPHQLATGGKENELKLWDIQEPGKPIFKAKNVRNDFLDLRVPVWVTDLQFLSEQKLVTCSGHRQVRVYDPAGPQRRPVLNVELGEYPLTALSVTPDCRSVIVGDSQGSMVMVDLRMGKVQKAFKGFAGAIRCLQCHPSLPLVASCGLDRFLRIHDINTKETLHKVYLKSRLNCLLFSSADFTQEQTEAPKKQKRKLESSDMTEEDEDELWGKMSVVQEGKVTDKTKRKAKSKKLKKPK